MAQGIYNNFDYRALVRHFNFRNPGNDPALFFDADGIIRGRAGETREEALTNPVFRFFTPHLRLNTTASAVPEASTLLLLGTGLAGVGATIRKRRKTN